MWQMDFADTETQDPGLFIHGPQLSLTKHASLATILFVVFVLRTGPHYAALAGLELTEIFLPLPRLKASATTLSLGIHS